MKKWLSEKSNILFLVIFALVLLQQVPVLRTNFSKKDEVISDRVLRVLGHKDITTVVFPPKDAKAITIFWASWCGPCKIEMSRLKKSVESGAIPKGSIFAINPFESDKDAEKFIGQNNYPFVFIEASNLADELEVRVTPTTLFLDRGTITEMSSGMSIWGIWKAEYFL